MHSGSQKYLNIILQRKIENSDFNEYLYVCRVYTVYIWSNSMKNFFEKMKSTSKVLASFCAAIFFFFSLRQSDENSVI